MQQTKIDLKREKEEFAARVNKRIEKNRQDIADLKAKAKTKKAESKKQYDKTINDLEKKNDELNAKLDNYGDESKEKWENFKEEFNHDLDRMGQAIGDLFRDNK